MSATVEEVVKAARHAAGRLRRRTVVYDRDDAFQDAALAAWRSGVSERSLLRTVAHRGMVDGVRRLLGRGGAGPSRRLRITLALQFSQDASGDVGDFLDALGRWDDGPAAVDDADLAESVRLWLAAAPPARRWEAFRLVYVEGTTTVEAARRMGCSQSTVCSLLNTALGRIRKAFSKEGADA